MSWKKYFAVVPSHLTAQQQQRMSDYERLSNAPGTTSKYSSFLPEIYAGHPNRIQRYYQYDDMDRDSDVNAALDCIADFCTQSEEQQDEPFEIHYNEDASETEVLLLKKYLVKWVKINNFRSKLWFMFRNTIKYGDAFFLRDPENFEWLWLDNYSVEGVKVDEENGKEPTEYLVRGLDYNRQGKFAAKKADMNNSMTPYGPGSTQASRPMASGGTSAFQMAGGARDPRQMRMMQAGGNELYSLDAKHIIHLSLNVGMDSNWPFGTSILDAIFKVYKQKELLEDSIIIYRVQRAPERRVFYIDVGQMPPAKAKAYIDSIKNEIHQRRIPNHAGGGSSILDAAYNPLSINDDYYFANNADGRGSKVETLPGGENLGEITDLSFFAKKMGRGLRIPTTYLSLGEDDNGGGASYNDGKLGSALIQEFRFNKYCMRLQSLMSPKFDDDFKHFLDENGVEIEESLFELRFLPPQNFTKYRQIEIDQAQVGVYQMIADNKKIAERMKQEVYLGWSEDQILRNEKLWAEENAAKLKKATGGTPAETEMGADLSSVGIRPPGDDMMMGGDEFGEMPPEEGGPPGQAPGGAPGPMGAGGSGGAPPGPGPGQ